MGNANCSVQPDTQNLCDISVGQQSPAMPGFCSELGFMGDSYREEYCGKMSNSEEWGDPKTVKNRCSYQDIGFGCCQEEIEHVAVIVGGGLSCKRLSFTGNPVTCCFNDLICSGQNPSTNPQLCFF